MAEVGENVFCDMLLPGMASNSVESHQKWYNIPTAMGRQWPWAIMRCEINSVAPAVGRWHNIPEIEKSRLEQKCEMNTVTPAVSRRHNIPEIERADLNMRAGAYTPPKRRQGKWTIASIAVVDCHDCHDWSSVSSSQGRAHKLPVRVHTAVSTPRMRIDA